MPSCGKEEITMAEGQPGTREGKGKEEREKKGGKEGERKRKEGHRDKICPSRKIHHFLIAH